MIASASVRVSQKNYFKKMCSYAKTPPAQKFLENLKNLNYAYIITEVLDGDVDYLEEKGIEYKKLRKYKDK